MEGNAEIRTSAGPSMYIEQHSPHDVIIPHHRMRDRIDEEAVQRLIQSIETIGLQTPPAARWVNGQLELIAGRHRVEACRRMGFTLIDFAILDATHTEARLWEIAENLHRAELTTLERARHIAEWVRLTEAKEGFLQVAKNPSGGRPGVVSAVTRELGIGRTEAHRSLKIAALAPEAKALAVEVGLDDNQSALLAAAKEATPEAQAKVIQERAAKKTLPSMYEGPGIRMFEQIVRDSLPWANEKNWQKALLELFARGKPDWHERGLEVLGRHITSKADA